MCGSPGKQLVAGRGFPIVLPQAVPLQRCASLSSLLVSCFALISDIGDNDESTHKSSFKKIDSAYYDFRTAGILMKRETASLPAA